MQWVWPLVSSQATTELRSCPGRMRGPGHCCSPQPDSRTGKSLQWTQKYFAHPPFSFYLKSKMFHLSFFVGKCSIRSRNIIEDVKRVLIWVDNWSQNNIYVGVLLDSLSVYYQDTLILGVGRCRAAGADKWVGEGKQHYSQ